MLVGSGLADRSGIESSGDFGVASGAGGVGAFGSDGGVGACGAGADAGTSNAISPREDARLSASPSVAGAAVSMCIIVV